MFEIKPLPQPETVTVPGAVYTLTHQMGRLVIDPRNPSAAAEVRTMKGFLDASGAFVDFGDAQVDTLDAQGLSDLLASTAGGKPAGDFRLSDLAPAIQKQKTAKEAARAAQEAGKPQKP